MLRDVASLMLFDNFDHTLGPRYLIECLPYFTELNLGIVKSDCLKLYVLGLGRTSIMVDHHSFVSAK